MLFLQLALSAILSCHPCASPPPCSAGHLAMPPPRQATPMPPDLSLLISELMGMLVFFFFFFLGWILRSECSELVVVYGGGFFGVVEIGRAHV